MAPRKSKETLLELCRRGTVQGNTISVRMLEYLTMAKHPPTGFRELALTFLDTCRVLWCIQAGLADAGSHKNRQFPTDMVEELDRKFRSTNDDFLLVGQMIAKFLDYERKGGGFANRLQKGFRMMFADADIAKMGESLAKNREALRMSALVFRWSVGDATVDRSVGFGYMGLAAALEHMDSTGSSSVVLSPMAEVTPEDASPTPIPEEVVSPASVNNASAATVVPSHPHPASQLPPVHPLGGGGGGLTYRDRSLNNHAHLSPLYHEFQSASTRQTSLSVPSVHSRSSRAPSLVSGPLPQSADMGSRRTNSSSSRGGNNLNRDETEDDPGSGCSTDDKTLIEVEEMLQELDLDLTGDGEKVMALKAEPGNVPRWQPRHTNGAGSQQLMSVLIDAVQTKKHKTIEQLLDRGVPPDGGPKHNLLAEAIRQHDPESLRLLLLFGAHVGAIDDETGFTALHTATETGFLDGAKLLIKYGADPNQSAGPNDDTPLSHAIVTGRFDFAQLFLMYGGDPNQIMANGNVVIIRAINKTTPTKVIQLMLHHGGDPNSKNGEGKTPLFEAISAARADIVTLLLDRGADPNLPGPKHMLWPATHHPPSLSILLARGADATKCSGLLELATSLNNLEAVQILLAAKVDPNCKKDNTYTPLCSAIRDNRANLVELLLASGADPNLKASEYPAFKCVTHHRPHLLPPLVAAGADLLNPPGIVETAVRHNDRAALLYLLDQGCPANAKSVDGHTPLTTAIRENRLDMVDLLLARGADPAIRGQDLPLCMAVRSPPMLQKLLPFVTDVHAFRGVMEMAVAADQLECVKLLLAAGVSVEDRNGGVFSPLTTAIREYHKDIVRFLLDEGGADVNAPGEHLPLIKAIRRHRGDDMDIIELLLARGADINKLYRGYSPVLQAVENGDASVLRVLVEKGNGVDFETRDDTGRTIMEVVQARGWSEAATILEQARTDAQPKANTEDAMS